MYTEFAAVLGVKLPRLQDNNIKQMSGLLERIKQMFRFGQVSGLKIRFVAGPNTIPITRTCFRIIRRWMLSRQVPR